MAVKNEFFLFEVVLQRLNPLVEERLLVIKGDFANIFSIELKDPKSMRIIIPEPPPPPPEPPGKKKKKKKPPKKKKGKKGKEPPPPPEPEILAGQSVLITSSPEVLVQNMRTCPLEVSLWSKDENLNFIGNSLVPWDEVFLKYLERVYSCVNATPPVVKDDYNFFEETTGKLLGKMTMQVKLTYLTDRIVSSFRTLTEDPVVRKVLYTGMNSKTTSYMCTLKTTDEEFEANIAKIPNKYVKDRQSSQPTGQPVVYADFTNAPGAEMPVSPDGDYCCKGNADKPAEGKADAPDVPDIDYICEYVRKIISSCNDNMRMLTPRPAIRPRMKATDLDKLCYCRETGWPQGDLAERFKRETQGGPCPICVRKVDGKPRPGTAQAPKRILDIANIRGPCGRPDCRIARDIRAYLEKIVEEDNKEIILDEIVGPCGSKECTLVDKIKDFLQHRGKFTHGAGILGMGAQCACLDQMQKALIRSGSCTSVCSHECEDEEDDNCGGRACPYRSSSKGSEATHASKKDDKKHDAGKDKKPEPKKEKKPEPKTETKPEAKKETKPEPKKDKKPEGKNVFYVYYFTVEYSTPPKPPGGPGKPSPSPSGRTGATSPTSPSATPPTPASQKSKPSTKATPSPSSTGPTSPTATTKASTKSSGSSSPTTAATHSKASSKSGTSSPTSQASSPAAHSKTSSKSAKSEVSKSDGKKRNKFKYCADKCPSAWLESDVCSKSVCGIAEKLKTSKKQYSLSCTNIKCPTREAEKQEPRTPSPADSNIELKFADIRNACCVKSCDVAERVKDIIMQGVEKKNKQKDKFDSDKDPCFCDCVCDFPIGGQTTYCAICGGYETCPVLPSQLPPYLQPHPCPVYHKLQDVKKNEKGPDDKSADAVSKSSRLTTGGKTLRAMQSGTKAASVASEKTDQSNRALRKKSKKKGKFTSPSHPGIGRPASHGHYHKYCYTHLDFVPKNMGWLWTAEDVPGLKFRPKWRPGAANKILVRRYRTVREGVDIILKKKRALLNRKKKIEMKPTLVVTKKDGEYTVQMEVFKKYSKERLRHQYPYDEKPPLIYTIGKTEEVKVKLQKQRERRERRETRRKNRMLQSTFRDKCQEICLKAYNQSMGILPMSNVNHPECPCDIRAIKPPSPVIDSCSCSDTGTLSSSDTDGDDWIIEFTPPMATWDTKGKHLPILVTGESQYNYLDYKVKCLDKQGNQVPRFFKGPDGKEECSDLGGFYGPDKIWLEINKDGYIGPDNRWVPPSFMAPDGGMYMTEEGVWTDSIGRIWKIGVDGYIDKDTKWQWYGGKRPVDKAGKSLTTVPIPSPDIKVPKPTDTKDASALKTAVNKLGKVASVLKTGHKAEIPIKTETKEAPHQNLHPSPSKKVILKSSKGKSPVVMNVAMTYNRQQQLKQQAPKGTKKQEKEKLARYKEIMDGLQQYEEMTIRPPTKTNRAVETRQGTRANVPKFSGARRNVSKYSVYDSNGLVSTSKVFTR